MFAPFPQTTHHLAVVFSTFTEIPGKQVVTDMLQQCVEVIWLICKRSNWCLTESQVGPIFWLFLAFRASKMRTLTNPGFGIKTKWRRGAAHNGGGATTHAPCAQKTRFFNCTKLSWLYDALTKRTLLQKMKKWTRQSCFHYPNDNSYFMDAWHDHVSMSHTKYGKDSQQLIVAVHCQSMDVRWEPMLVTKKV